MRDNQDSMAFISLISYRPLDWLYKNSSMSITKKNMHNWPLMWDIDRLPVIFPARKDSNAERTSISWRHCWQVKCIPQNHDDVIKWKHFPHFTDPLCGEFTSNRWIPTQRPVTRSFDVFFGVRLNKRLSKQSWSWWFETPSRSLWHHCYVMTSTTYDTMTLNGLREFITIINTWLKQCDNS